MQNCKKKSKSILGFSILDIFFVQFEKVENTFRLFFVVLQVSLSRLEINIFNVYNIFLSKNIIIMLTIPKSNSSSESTSLDIAQSSTLNPNDNSTNSKLEMDQPGWLKVIIHPGYQSLIVSGGILIFLYFFIIFNFKALFQVDPVSLMKFLSLFIIAVVSHGMIAITMQQDLGRTLSSWY